MEQMENDSRSFLAVIMHTVRLILMTILSLTGNLFVCFAFNRNRRLRTVTNFYVLSLAVADKMVAVFGLPFAVVASGLRWWPFSDEFCQFSGFLAISWAMVSLCTLVLTSVNRYYMYCVVKPQRCNVVCTKKKTIASIVFIWILLFVFQVIFYSTTNTSF